MLDVDCLWIYVDVRVGRGVFINRCMILNNECECEFDASEVS